MPEQYDLDGATVRVLNDRGQIGGAIGTTGGITTLSGGLTTFTIAGSNYVFVNGINNAGEVVGYYADASGTHGYLRNSNGSILTFDVPGAVNTTVANGVNDLGQIAGYYYDGSVSHGYLRGSSGIFLTIDHPALGFPFTTNTYLYGINNAGTIVGSYGPGRNYAGGFYCYSCRALADRRGLSVLRCCDGCHLPKAMPRRA